jgi:hypothetical protein
MWRNFCRGGRGGGVDRVEQNVLGFNSEPGKKLPLTRSLASHLRGTEDLWGFGGEGSVWWVAGGFEESGGVNRSNLLAIGVKIKKAAESTEESRGPRLTWKKINQVALYVY